MVQTPVYMDNQSTTRVDPRVVEAMLPYFSEHFGNAGSTSHAFGLEAKEAVDRSRQSIADAIGAKPREIVFTSGATESNNLALRGLAERAKRKGQHLVSVATEHKAILDPLSRLGRRGFQVTLLPVAPQGEKAAGRIDLNRLEEALRADTILVSVMWANNEVGTLQPLTEIAEICHRHGVLLHSDATQAVGKLPVNMEAVPVDLMSFSAHKFHGPKGIGALYIRRKTPPIRLEPLLDGGAQENGFRSGTLNVPAIVGMARALEIFRGESPTEADRIRSLRGRLLEGLLDEIDGVQMNGPDTSPELRLGGNLNCSFADVDGEALMMSMSQLAVSSGSACTSANPEPSHVLRALGISDDQTRASLRFGLSRFKTSEEVEFAIETVAAAVKKLRSLSSLARP